MIKEIDKPKEPSRIAVKFANMVFVLGILYSVLIAIYAIYRIYQPIYEINLEYKPLQIFYYKFILFSGVSATLFILGLKLSNNLKVNLSILFVTISILTYIFETYLEFLPEQKRLNEEIAKELDVLFDTRAEMEVLEDLNNSGVEAYPPVTANLFIHSNGINTHNGKIYPLGGISNITTIHGNESGFYPIVKTDEYGFNNPKELYSQNKVDIFLLGDSFAAGCCVHSDETIAAVLRSSGFNALSFGKGGNGPLIELATLKEYAEPIQPKIVLWLYFENDLPNLSNEIKAPFLRNYLNDNNFSQNLMLRQDEIDGVLINFFREKLQWVQSVEGEEEAKRVRNANISAIKILKLFNLRFNFKIMLESRQKQNLDLFQNILNKSKQIVSKWEGKIYFVYLPSYHRYSNKVRAYEDIGFWSNPEHVLRMSTKLNIPVIDIHEKVFNIQPDPLSLFPFRMYGHYNAKGNRLVAEAISKRLKDDGIIPSKLNKSKKN